jgi:hypothetical protein
MMLGGPQQYFARQNMTGLLVMGLPLRGERQVSSSQTFAEI